VKRIARKIAGALLTLFGIAVVCAGLYVIAHLPGLIGLVIGLVFGVLLMALCAAAGRADREREWQQMMDEQTALLARVQRERNELQAQVNAREVA
jgi:uncharacterized membrane-anchored protein YhcB (DUF1043 family)